MVRYDSLPDLVGTLELIGEGRLPADALLHTVRQRLSTVEPRVHAYRRLSPGLDTAVPGAGPLAGVPLAVKDLIDVQDLPTEGGSPAYHWVPVRHAPVVDRLVRAGAVVVGKAHTRELAFGITCPPTVNPWDLTRTTGGSSGGSAAALAAGLAWAALGTDTAGSIRIPAALTGVAGLKPTHGRLSVQGIMALSWTYDAVGPMA
ncbi:MAG: amidase family protein, partial [Clostridia bacterium]